MADIMSALIRTETQIIKNEARVLIEHVCVWGGGDIHSTETGRPELEYVWNIR